MRKRENRKIPGLTMAEREALLDSPLISGVGEGLREELLDNGKAGALRRGEFLFVDGDPVGSVYCLLSGKLKEYFDNDASGECLRCLQTPGSYVSLHLTFEPNRRYAYCCKALKDSTYFAWDAGYFLELVKRESALAFHVAAEISSAFENSCRLNGICRKPQALPRVADYLLHRCSGCPGCARVVEGTKLSADISPIGLTASDIHLARETFSRALASLQKDNIIRLAGGVVEIVDVRELKKISETE